MSTLGRSFNLNEWINANREEMKPPVGNKVIWKDSKMMVMLIAGPNQRNDYHITPSEEFFHQLQGDMILKLIDPETQERIDMPLREGDVFMIPPFTPHRPVRKANTIGLVVEYARPEGQNDHFVWYCDNCDELIYDVEWHLTQLDEEIKPRMEAFYASEELRTCKACGTVKELPTEPVF
ncbi:MAG: 3-hydroxyanthranilate 3,4-dioxygenase [Gemmatimonadota bacterium]|nr:3-hydroxyanthranilate 3,4-dioxygenase [Gemmatimonadota bacterium]